MEVLCKEGAKRRRLADQKFIAEALVELVTDGLLTVSGGIYKMRSFSVSLSNDLAKLWPKILAQVSLPVARIPVVQDLSEAIGMPRRVLDKCLNEAVGIKYLVKVSEKRFFLPRTVSDLREKCISMGKSSSDGRFKVADFRDKTGIGRNAAVEILEYFDREQLTLRQGNYRMLRR